ncbi:MAG TPA: glycoside hydrolase family 15 protein [Ktedonobacterales bacterium]
MHWSDTPNATSEPGDVDRAARQMAERVAAMRLSGAISLIIVETDAIWDGQRDDHAGQIVRKLVLLAAHEHTHIVIRGPLSDDRRRRITASGAAGADGERHISVKSERPESVRNLIDQDGTTAGECLALLADSSADAPPGCLAFYVGSGDPPTNTKLTRLAGPEATDKVLALYGTALAQERAGQAFRAASTGASPPAEAAFDRGILTGVARSAARPGAPSAAPSQPLPDRDGLRDLARRAYGHLRRNLLPSGAVVGAPVRGQHSGEPNYWFFWQRDAAAAMSWLIEWHQRGLTGLEAADLAEAITRYAAFIERIQGHGHLGTSRYTVAGDPIQGYGNPQLDGPALSALALARVTEPVGVWGRLQVYLDFLATPTAESASVDAWEFIYGRHFNVVALQARALGVGARVAERLGHHDHAARYDTAAARLAALLASFVDPSSGCVVAHRATVSPWFEATSRLDMIVPGALLAAWTPPRPDTPAIGRDLTNLAHPAILTTMSALEEAFASLYAANRDWRAGGNTGFGLGRFPEDANDGVGSTGGNPWPLTTLWGAQFYYRLAQELDATERAQPGRALLTDPRQSTFLNRVAGAEVVATDHPLALGVWRERLLPALVAAGDGYLNFVVHHVPLDGGVTEQIDRDTGQPRGAPCLSWALAELIGTIAVREDVYGLVERGGEERGG